MKHAYLILAHNEFDLLQQLVAVLDDPRNDIYIHFDKKVVELPLLNVAHSGLHILTERVDVRWGSVSQIKTEYKLFEAASASSISYSRYHIISGTHLPLKTQNYIHDFFKAREGKQVLSFLYTNAYEIDMKLARYHFFLNYFQYGKKWQRLIANFCWHVLLKLQYVFRIHRTTLTVTVKANNWVSLTPDAVVYILSQKADLLHDFRWSLCGDEFFVPYLLARKGFDILDEQVLLYNDFQGSNPRLLTMEDYTMLTESNYLFARKFGSEHSEVVAKIVAHLKANQ